MTDHILDIGDVEGSGFSRLDEVEAKVRNKYFKGNSGSLNSDEAKKLFSGVKANAWFSKYNIGEDTAADTAGSELYLIDSGNPLKVRIKIDDEDDTGSNDNYIFLKTTRNAGKANKRYLKVKYRGFTEDSNGNITYEDWRIDNLIYTVKYKVKLWGGNGTKSATLTGGKRIFLCPDGDTTIFSGMSKRFYFLGSPNKSNTDKNHDGANFRANFEPYVILDVNQNIAATQTPMSRKILNIEKNTNAEGDQLLFHVENNDLIVDDEVMVFGSMPSGYNVSKGKVTWVSGSTLRVRNMEEDALSILEAPSQDYDSQNPGYIEVSFNSFKDLADDYWQIHQQNTCPHTSSGVQAHDTSAAGRKACKLLTYQKLFEEKYSGVKSFNVEVLSIGNRGKTVRWINKQLEMLGEEYSEDWTHFSTSTYQGMIKFKEYMIELDPALAEILDIDKPCGDSNNDPSRTICENSSGKPCGCYTRGCLIFQDSTDQNADSEPTDDWNKVAQYQRQDSFATSFVITDPMFPSSKTGKIISIPRGSTERLEFRVKPGWRVALRLHIYENNSPAASAWKDGNYLDYLLATDDTIKVHWNGNEATVDYGRVTETSFRDRDPIETSNDCSGISNCSIKVEIFTVKAPYGEWMNSGLSLPSTFGIQEGLSAIGKMQKQISEFMGLNPLDVSAELKLSFGIEVTLIQIFNLYFGIQATVDIKSDHIALQLGLETYANMSSPVDVYPATAQASASVKSGFKLRYDTLGDDLQTVFFSVLDPLTRPFGYPLRYDGINELRLPLTTELSSLLVMGDKKTKFTKTEKASLSTGNLLETSVAGELSWSPSSSSIFWPDGAGYKITHKHSNNLRELAIDFWKRSLKKSPEDPMPKLPDDFKGHELALQIMLGLALGPAQYLLFDGSFERSTEDVEGLFHEYIEENGQEGTPFADYAGHCFKILLGARGVVRVFQEIKYILGLARKAKSFEEALKLDKLAKGGQKVPGLSLKWDVPMTLGVLLKTYPSFTTAEEMYQNIENDLVSKGGIESTKTFDDYLKEANVNGGSYELDGIKAKIEPQFELEFKSPKVTFYKVIDMGIIIKLAGKVNIELDILKLLCIIFGDIFSTSESSRRDEVLIRLQDMLSAYNSRDDNSNGGGGS